MGLSYLDSVRTEAPEVNVRGFAGKTGSSYLSWLMWRMMKSKGVQESDSRDWDATPAPRQPASV
jgi:hypothetical protein